MNDPKEIARQLNLALKSNDLIKEYNALAAKVAESSELNELEGQLKALQQQLVDSLDKDLQELHSKLICQYNELKQIYLNNPLYQNYTNYKEEVNSLLKELESIINNI